jgi:hypothetical protein
LHSLRRLVFYSRRVRYLMMQAVVGARSADEIPPLVHGGDSGKPTVGVYPDNPERFPRPEELKVKIAKLRALMEYLPELEKPSDSTLIEVQRVETARRLREYFDNYGRHFLNHLESRPAGSAVASIAESLGSPSGMKVMDAMPGRGPIREVDIISGEGRGSVYKEWKTGRTIREFLSGCEGNTFLLSDSDITLAPTLDALRIILDEEDAKTGKKSRLGVLVLDSHADAYASGKISKANALGFALGKVARGYAENVVDAKPTVAYAAVVGLNPSAEFQSMSDTMSALLRENRISVFTDTNYFVGEVFDTGRLNRVGQRAVDAMLAAGGYRTGRPESVTHLVFHVDPDFLPRNDYHGFEYNMLELLSRRKWISEGDSLRQRREFLSIADAVHGIDHHRLRGINANLALEFMKKTAEYARTKGIEVGVPAGGGRFVANVGEYVPEWDRDSAVRDFIVRAVRYMDTQVKRMYGGKNTS